MIYWLTNWLMHEMADWLINGLIDWPNYWLTHWKTGHTHVLEAFTVYMENNLWITQAVTYIRRKLTV